MIERSWYAAGSRRTTGPVHASASPTCNATRARWRASATETGRSPRRRISLLRVLLTVLDRDCEQPGQDDGDELLRRQSFDACRREASNGDVYTGPRYGA